MRKISLPLISIVFLSSCFLVPKSWKKSESFTKVQKSTDYDYKLRMAEKYYVNKDYNHAQLLYDDLFRVMKGSEHFEDIYYKYAYCAYYLKDYLNAENLFKGFSEAFPNSPKAEEMDYMRAYCFYKQSPKVELDQTNTTKAIGFMQAFISTHPGSERIKEANEIIDKCRAKLELKDFESAKLYYNLKASNPAYLKAAGLAFNSLLNTYPDSEKSDEYKLYVIKSNYEYATLSLPEKKEMRFEQVVTDCNDFMDRFPDSKFKKQVQEYLDLSTNTLKVLKNEPVKKTS
ncbi:MAG: outer membrane protein assembly factor BamD [Bacteroidetes bacterium]|nr:MAG: outer membrane protein assembly factor BamD [Bacteroidota bacterium]